MPRRPPGPTPTQQATGALVVGVVLVLWSVQYGNAGIRPAFDLPVAVAGGLLVVVAVGRVAFDRLAADDKSTRPARTWWYLLAGQCLFLTLFAVSTAGLGLDPTAAALSVPNACLLLAYPFAMWGDTAYVRSTAETWDPDRWVYLAGGLFVVATVGVGTYLVSPVYLYRRHRHLGTP